ncbi:MAG: DegT/DnrJ/EryC1/StrS family aminotransferase [Ruminococcaceae bacterium]|nr:DegT/DnrJ/EryC1/StrS family aminotransferase [Oscillospiraceae bacterium]
MKVPFSPPDITENEIEKVVEVLKSGWITTGPVTKKFEKDISGYTGSKMTACLNSATAAMEISLRILGIGPGDEVITSAYTYTASASVIDHVGAKIVMADTLPDSCLIDVESLSSLINERTKAVIPVDIAGVPVDYKRIMEILEEKRGIYKPSNIVQEKLGRVALISDAAHSFGAVYEGKNVATLADFACFSFHAVKNLTTSEGGCICFGDIGEVPAERIYKGIMLISLHGQTKDAFSKQKVGGWEYDIVVPGYKCNMTDVHAAIGAGQLERYDDILKRRKELTKIYDDILKGTKAVPIQHTGENYTGSHHAYIVRFKGADVEKRNLIIEEMAKREVALNVHFKPLPLMTAYKSIGFRIENYPNAYGFYKNAASLPLWSMMSDEQAIYTAENLIEVMKEVL